MAKHKIRVGYIGLSIPPFYDREHRQRERAIAGLEAIAEQLSFDLVAISDVIDSLESARNAAASLRKEKLDFLLIQSSAVAMGEQLLALAHVAPRLGLWATPDPDLEGPIQFHSLVTMNHYASILKRYLRDEEIPFKWFYGHVESDEFRQRFAVTIRALTAVKNIEKTRIGWIGGLSPGFEDMIFDERKLKHRLGITVRAHELRELVNRAKGYDAQIVQRTAGDIRGAAAAVKVTEHESFDRVTRLYLAMRDLIAEHDYDTLAVQCWPTVQSEYSVAPCMSYGWMGSEDGIAVSCEGDVLGAISMHLLNILTGAEGSSTLLDLTALDFETNTALMWHCGVSPRHFANKDGISWVDHVTLGRKMADGPYGVAGDQLFAPQPSTITYVGDDGGSLLVLKSDIVEHPHQKKGFDGTRGWFANFTLNKKDITLWDLINTLTVRGHEHHFAVGQGDVTSELMEFAAWKGLRLVEGVPYVDYLQIEGVNI